MKDMKLAAKSAVALAIYTWLHVSAVSAGCSRETLTAKDHSPDADVITVTAPLLSPLELLTSPKTPRQPVPASDGSSYLKTIPGFSQIRNGGTNGDPVLRGMFGSRLRILTNDGEMLGACPARMDAPSSYISPENFDLLTIIKGPQTVLWGPGNSAGTIRLNRQPPEFDKADIKGSASLLTAARQHHDANADLSLGNSDGFVRLLANKSQAKDYKDGHGDLVASRWDKWNADIDVGWTPDKDTLWQISAGRGNGQARYAGRSMDGSQFKRESLGMGFEKSNISDIWNKLEANVYYNYANHIMDNDTLRSPVSAGGSGSAISMKMPMSMSMNMPMKMQLDRRTFGGRMMSTWLWRDYQLRSGADFQLNTHRSHKKFGWQQDARFHDYGVFSELTWQATEQGKLITGARLDRVLVDNATSKGASERSDILPAGFSRYEYNLSSQPVMVYAGVGYTQRFPDYWELFSPIYGPDGSRRPFDTVKTEKTTQLDIGARYKSKALTGWVSAYAGSVDDFILFRYNPFMRSSNQVSNVNATTLGGEAGASYQLTEILKTDLSVAYSWAENSDSHQALPQIPPLEGRLGLTFEKNNWSSSGLLRLVSPQHRVALNQGNVVGKDFSSSAGFAIFSANAAYKISEMAKLSAGIDNIFNHNYSEHLNLAGNSSFGYSINTPVNEPGRTWWAKLNLTF